MKTLPREPWRGSQICGYQTEYGTVGGRTVFCGERKANGLYFCQEHHDDVMDNYGEVRMAPGNARGDLFEAVRLRWEPSDGGMPVEPTREEMAAYVAA